MKKLSKEQYKEIIKKHFDKRISQTQLAKEYNVSRVWIRILCSKKGTSPFFRGYKIPDEKIIDLYVNKKMSVKAIADKLNIGWRQVNYRLKKSGIPKRRKSLRKELENSIEHYNLKTKIWAAKVIDRDKLLCKMCGIDNSFKNRLEAHHIKPVKEIDGEKDLFDLGNGITLCRKCHMKVHYKENEFKEIFFDLIRQSSV